MSDLGLALAVHLLAVVWWIGGLAFITAVFLPTMRRVLGADPQAAFCAIEGRFAPQARAAVLLAGLSGGYLLWRLQAWRWLAEPGFWWLDAMLLYWLLFVLLLFVLEPLGVLRRRRADAAGGWRRLQGLHALLLALAFIIIAGAAAGSHGF